MAKQYVAASVFDACHNSLVLSARDQTSSSATAKSLIWLVPTLMASAALSVHAVRSAVAGGYKRPFTMAVAVEPSIEVLQIGQRVSTMSARRARTARTK
jgi:hypothetical protein